MFNDKIYQVFEELLFFFFFLKQRLSKMIFFFQGSLNLKLSRLKMAKNIQKQTVN